MGDNLTNKFCTTRKRTRSVVVKMLHNTQMPRDRMNKLAYIIIYSLAGGAAEADENPANRISEIINTIQ